MKRGDVLLTSGLVGIGLAVCAYGYGIIFGIPNTAGLVYMGFGLGVILGVIAAPYIYADRKRVVPPAVPSPGKPVEIYWKDPERQQVMSICKLTTVTDAELRAVAVKVIHKGTRLTYRALGDVLDKTKIANFQGELIDRRLARWRVYGEDGRPVPQQGIELTERGHKVMVESLKQSPAPAFREWAENTYSREAHTNVHTFYS